MCEVVRRQGRTWIERRDSFGSKSNRRFLSHPTPPHPTPPAGAAPLGRAQRGAAAEGGAERGDPGGDLAAHQARAAAGLHVRTGPVVFGVGLCGALVAYDEVTTRRYFLTGNNSPPNPIPLTPHQRGGRREARVGRVGRGPEPGRGGRADPPDAAEAADVLPRLGQGHLRGPAGAGQGQGERGGVRRPREAGESSKQSSMVGEGKGREGKARHHPPA